MKPQGHPSISLVLLGLALTLAGCKSYGPQFDAYSKNPGPAQDPPEQQAQKLFRLEDSAFEKVVATNAIPPQWREMSTNYFQLGPGDVVEIERLDEAKPRVAALVGPDGKIYHSLLPGLFVWGLSLHEAKELLERELARYIRVKPDITLTLRSAASQRVWILGAVLAPGVFSLATPKTLLEAISMAGGLARQPGAIEETADLHGSFVMRNGQMLPIDLEKLLREGDLAQNIYLRPDDFVFVRPSTARNVHVLGAVPLPNVVPFTDPMSLVSAIARVGGTLDYAYLSHIAVLRGSLAEPRIALVDYRKIRAGQAPDVLLEPGDIVYVPFSPFRDIALLAEELVGQVVRTVAINAGQSVIYPGQGPVGVSVGLGTPISVGSPSR